MKIESGEYCGADSELDSLRLKVKVTYTNKSKEQFILYKGSRLISRIMISRTFGDLAAKRFEVNSSLTQLTSGGDECYTGRAPSSCFVFLPPGASYETHTTVGIFVVRGDVREIAGAVKSGDHLLQAEVITWYESDQMAKDLRRRWRRSGKLWVEPLTSEPLPFTVEREHKRADCP